MNAKRPFRLTLKSRSADTKSRNTNKEEYVHPLAGQQDLLRQQYSKQLKDIPLSEEVSSCDLGDDATDDMAGPSSLHTTPDRSDVETLSGTRNWFGSLDTDEESILSIPSPTEANFGSLFTSVQDVFQQQQEKQQNESSKSEFIVNRQVTQQPLSTLSPEKKQAELLQMLSSANTSSSAREGGILSRLKRISKKEKSRALREASGLDLQPVTIFSEASGPPKSPKSSDIHNLEADPLLTLRKAVTEQIPNLQRPRGDRIKSVQPSLVDDESIMGRNSMAASLLDFETFDEEEDWRNMPDLQSIHSHLGMVDNVDTEEDGQEDQDFSLDTIPGSFLEDADYSTSEDLSQDHGSMAPIEFGGDLSQVEIEPSTPAETAFHEADRSEYSAALSRQPSMYSSNLNDRLSNIKLEEDEEEEVATPRAIVEESSNSYFPSAPLLTPQTSSAQSIASLASISTPTKEEPVKKYDWYQNANLNAQQRYYFLRNVFSRELIWEFERLFLVFNTTSLFQPSPRASLPRTDLSYFKSDAKTITPDLPLMRFLYKNVLSTCPIFGPAQPIEGAAAIRARKAGAKKFMDEALLPLLRFRQKASLSIAIDIHGEWSNEVFDSPSTTGVMIGSLFKTLTRLMVALVPDNRSQACAWSTVPIPSSAAYLRHRLAPSKLKQGGMEVNVVGARLRSSPKECELLLSVRRFGFPPHYVVRTENDFYQYARALAEELGRRTRIRPVPPPFNDELLLTELIQNSKDENVTVSDRSLNGSPTRRNGQQERFYSKANSSSSSLRSPASPVPGSSGSLSRLQGNNRSSASFGSASSTRLSNEQQLNQPSSSLAAASSQAKALLPEKSRFLYRSKAVTTESSTEINSATSQTTLDSSNNIVPTTGSAPETRDDESRRKQLRSWLRDALSVKGAGHANETKSFLNNGAFTEKDVRSATKRDVERRSTIDIRLIQERELSTINAPDEIVELQKEMKTLWRDCVEGDGLLKALEAVKVHDTFSALPLPYQRVISWTNLQVAQFVHHTFLNSHEARSNFDRAAEFLQCIPWKALSLALREPTGLMIQKIKGNLSQEFIIKKILALQLDDVPAKKLDRELMTLKKRLGSTITRKLQGFVEGTEWQKRVIRKASKRNNIPLVAAIVRGDDKPLLAADGIKRVVKATRVYQEFMITRPNYEEKRAKQRVNSEVRLICDMQYTLKLLSLRRNGEKIRIALKEELRAPIQAFLEPLFSLLKRLHRSKILSSYSGGADVIMELQAFAFKLLDVLAGLKMRIQDPWRSLSTLTLLLDDVVPSWYRLLHHFSNIDNLVADLIVWLKEIISMNSKGKGEDSTMTTPTPTAAASLSMIEVAKHWQPPKGGLNQSDLNCISEHIKLGKEKRTRQMEAACRWAAGDIDADHSIQLVGEGGKTRVTPYHLSQEPQSVSIKLESLDVYLSGLRSALGHFM